MKLLNELSNNAAAQSFPMSEIDCSPVEPSWDFLERAGVIDVGNGPLFSRLSVLNTTERGDVICQHSSVYFQAINRAVASKPPSLSAAAYLIWIFFECVRDDSSILDHILETVNNAELFDSFRTFLTDSRSEDRFDSVKDKAASILASFIARALKSAFSMTQVQCLADVVLQNGIPGLSLNGRMEFIKNLLKQDRFRGVIWQAQAARELILGHLDLRQEIPVVYLSLFCLWLLSFNEKVVPLLYQSDIVPTLCNILAAESKTDKVVRLAVRILINLLGNDDCVEQLIVGNAVHILTLLEYEKWRDEELYDEIRCGLAAVQNKIRLISNFDRYCRELNTGRLRWSYLHTEKFWRENVMNFEENKFAAVGKLAELLGSPDPTTVAVACHDLGEFARFHPTGKKVIRQLKIKDVVMTLMAHRDRDVLREALLSVQKMMLAHWQNVAETSSSVTAGASTGTGIRTIRRSWDYSVTA